MKNKKLYSILFCCLICSLMLIINCSAVTVKKHWWGEEYYLASHEVTEFRLNAQSVFQKISLANRATEVASGIIAGVHGAIAGAVVVEAQQIAIDSFITDLERWENKKVDIIVSLPGVIQGWSIKEQ